LNGTHHVGGTRGMDRCGILLKYEPENMIRVKGHVIRMIHSSFLDWIFLSSTF